MKISALLLLMILLQLSDNHPEPHQPGQNEEEAVEIVVRGLFTAMAEANGDAVASLFTEDATLRTVDSSEREAEFRETEISQFANIVNGAEPGFLDEQLTSFRVFVDDNLATAWMDYQFYAGGEFSHCGVNSMNLIRQKNSWKIFSIVDTRRQENC